MKSIIPTVLLDSYKISHKDQYPKGTEVVYSNLTARSSKHLKNVKYSVFVGLQYFILEYLIHQFNQNFFYHPLNRVMDEHREIVEENLGQQKSYQHIEELWSLGHLPIEIKALPEGTRVPIGIPYLTIRNTNFNFSWLTNSLESLLSNILWKPIVSATIADMYKQTFELYNASTGSSRDTVAFQGHDFSFRGMSGIESACLSGFGHCCSFLGSDTVPVIPFVKQYYNHPDTGKIAVSVPASEHSVECLHSVCNGIVDETGYVQHMLDTYPSGVFSIVSDGFDFWHMLTKVLPKFKDQIMQREGTLVVRPDSGDPVKIICGDPDASKGSPEYKGAIEVLWDIFGGTFTNKGYKKLDSHISLIYGDSITLERQEAILYNLGWKDFASSNVVLGIGSYTYNMNTRDSLGIAMKATYGEVNGVPCPIFKDPKTDSGMKKSATGLLSVNAYMELEQNCSKETEKQGLLKPVFVDGALISRTSLKEIRDNLSFSPIPE